MTETEFRQAIGDGAFVYIGKETDNLVPGTTGEVKAVFDRPGIAATFKPHGQNRNYPIGSSADLWSGHYDTGDGTIWNALNRMYRHLETA